MATKASRIALAGSNISSTGEVDADLLDNIDSAAFLSLDSNGRLGIGISPDTALHVYHSTSNGVATFESGDNRGGIALKDNSTTQPIYLMADGNSFIAQVNAVERMRINSSGRMGIATNGAVTDIPGTSHDTVVVGNNGMTASGVILNVANGSNSTFGFYDNTGTTPAARMLWDSTNDQLQFYTRNSSANGEGIRMVINDSGNVGIGTTGPNESLHIYRASGDASFKLQNANQTLRIDQNSIRSTTNHALGMFTNNNSSNGFRIENDGRMIIGNTSGQTNVKLTIKGNVKMGSAAHSSWANSINDIGGLDIIVGSGSTGLTVWDDNAQTTPRFKVERTGNVGIGTSTPTEQLHLYKAVTNGGHHTYMKLQQYQPDLGGIGEHGSFIDFDFQDNNDNHRPQVQIGAELGNRNETDLGQISEGRGNFVVKTTAGASPYNPAYGTAPTEVFRVTYDGYINAKGAVINSKKIESSTSTNSTNTGAVVIAATAITMTKRNHDQSRFLYSITLSHEVDGNTTNTNGFLRLEYRISSLGQTSFTSVNKVITVGGMSDYSGGTNNNSFQFLFTPPNFNKNETIEMRLIFNKSNAQSVHFNQQNLSSQPSGTQNYALGYVLEMGL